VAPFNASAPRGPLREGLGRISEIQLQSPVT
jgi:hypothetical protein